MYIKIPPKESRTVVRRTIFEPCALVAIEGTLKGWSPGAFEDVYVQARFNDSVVPFPTRIGADPFWKFEGFAVQLCPFPFDHEGELKLVVRNMTEREIEVRCGLIMGKYVTGIQ